MPPNRNTRNKSTKNDKLSSPLDTEKKKVAEQEAKIRAEMERCQHLIEEAPKLAAEKKRREAELVRTQREEAVKRRAKIEGRFGSLTALPDRRYELNAGAPAKQRRLRAERNRGRLMFFILLLVFGATVTFLWITVTRG